MATITWQDGFEGGEDLVAVYGAGNVRGGASITVGNGRGGGNALVCSGSGVAHTTGISAPTDPIQIGIARVSGSAGNANLVLEDGGVVATVQIDGLDRASLTLYITGFPTYNADAPRILGVWRYLECFFKADPVNGRFALAIDGDTVLDVSGIRTAGTGRGPSICSLNGSGCLIDDWYMETGNAAPNFKGDYVVTGLAPGASGSIPTPGPVRVDQQFITVAETAPKPTVRVDQQFIILAIKNKPGAPVRPQVFGVGRV